MYVKNNNKVIHIFPTREKSRIPLVSLVWSSEVILSVETGTRQWWMGFN